MGRATILGLGGYVPGRRVTNAMLEQTLDTTDEWITQRTGVRVRYFCESGEATSDLAVKAGRRALEHAGVQGVDMLVLATTTPDHPCPATAPAVAAALGLGTVPAFDLQAVCSGFLYASRVAASLVDSGAAETVLVIGADAFSSILDPSDRTTSVIFGDGAGAAVIGRSDDETLGWGSFELGADGALREAIIVSGGGSREASASDAAGFAPYFRMEGKRVFRAAVDAMAGSCRTVLGRSGWEPDDVDYLVGHQANARILRSVAYVLGLPEKRVVLHLDDVGNTSAASIPLALTAYSHRFTPGSRIVLTAFGGGATWGAATLSWPRHLTETTIEGAA
ncbi:beta-ketoacyl-ACP synthase III [Gordonia sputi]